MFMQYSAEELLWPTGIQHARHVSGRKHHHPAGLNVTDAFPCTTPGFVIELDPILLHQTTTKQLATRSIKRTQKDINSATITCCCWIVLTIAALLLSYRYIKTAAIYSCSKQEFKHLGFSNCLDSILREGRNPLHIDDLLRINAESPPLLLLCAIILSYPVPGRSGVSFEIIQFLILYLLYVHVIVVTKCKEFLNNSEQSAFETFSCYGQEGVVVDYSAYLVPIVVFRVRALYAGSLVTNRTTAPRHHSPLRSYTVLLAALCIILATLTIAARCYASTNTIQSIVQLSPNYPQPQHTISPILIKYNSNSQLLSSKIVLSRLFENPRKYVQSDTSVIATNSKLLIPYNQNINYKTGTSTFSSKLRTNSRKKREFRSTKPQFYKYNQDSSVKKFGARRLDQDGANNILTTNEISSSEIEYKHVDNSINQNDNSPPPTFNKRTKIPFIKTVLQPATSKYSVSLEQIASTTTITIADSIQSATTANSATSAARNTNHNNKSANNSSRVTSTFLVDHQNDPGFDPTTAFDQTSALGTGINPFMPPAHGNENNSLRESVLVLVVAVVVLTLALGLVTCVLSHYRGGTAGNPHDAAHTPITAPMLSVVSAGATAGVGGMDRLRGRGVARELAATRDRQVRLHAVHTDIAINLPPSISLPDGEEHPFNSRLHIRDTEQESEIYQKCIRPPPNRTALESESPPPYRSSSAGLLGSLGGSSSSGSSDWSGGSVPPMVVRCHSLSSTSKRLDHPAGGPTSSGQKTDFIQRTVKIFTGKKSQPPPAPTLPPVVIVPTRTRRTTEHNLTTRPKPNV